MARVGGNSISGGDPAPRNACRRVRRSWNQPSRRSGGPRPARGPYLARWGSGSDACRGGCPQRQSRIHSGSPVRLVRRRRPALLRALLPPRDPVAASFGWSRFWDAWQWPVIAWLAWRAPARRGDGGPGLARAPRAVDGRRRRVGRAALALTVLVTSASTDTGIDPCCGRGRARRWSARRSRRSGGPRSMPPSRAASIRSASGHCRGSRASPRRCSAPAGASRRRP